jgi:hypothetical protein
MHKNVSVKTTIIECFTGLPMIRNRMSVVIAT